MTARPDGLARALASKERRTVRGAGAEMERLPFCAVLADIRSLWNVGSIFRSADLCGVRELLLTGITGCPPRPEIGKTALGAEEVVAWSYYAHAEAALGRMQAEGFTPVALETSPRAVPMDEARWPERCCLVLGNEVVGVAPTLLKACPQHVSIPMYGVKDSFNIAVAFGIAAQRIAAVLMARRRGG